MGIARIERRRRRFIGAFALGGVGVVVAGCWCEPPREEPGPRMTEGSIRLVLRSTPAEQARGDDFRDRCLGGELLSKVQGSGPRLLIVRRDGPTGAPRKSGCELVLPPRRGADDDVVASAASGNAAVEVWQLVADCDGDESAPVRLRNHYYPKAGRDREVLEWRLHASGVREKLGRPRGCVWKRLGGPEGAPTVIWELPVDSVSGELAEAERAASSSPEFRSVVEHMKTLIDRFEPERWDVVGP